MKNSVVTEVAASEAGTLVDRARENAEQVLQRLPSTVVYHNLNHTRQVVGMTEEIGRASGLSPEELDIALIAAWFHDTGYVNGSKEGHEDRSKVFAEAFLREEGAPEETIEAVLLCIDGTKLPQKPTTRLAEVVADADLSHTAADNCLDLSELLRQELTFSYGKIGKKKWLRGTLDFFGNHHFFTPYAKEVLEKKKEANLEHIRRQLEEKEAEGKEEKEEKTEKKGKKEGKKDDEGGKKTFRGIETMFRVTSQNHNQFSAMADNKANIMISVNTIIISVILSVLIRKLEEWPHLIIPTVMLVTTCLFAIVFAVLATRPNVIRGTFTKEDVLDRNVNLLFFGNFSRMELADYEWGMKEMMNDPDFLYSSMTRDIFLLGKVLDKKYRMLRISYNIFMFGFVSSVLAFAAASIYFQHH